MSRLALTVDGDGPPLLASHRRGASASDQVHVLAADAHGSPTALLRRERTLGTGCVDRYSVWAFEGGFSGEILLEVEHDLADLLEIKEGGALPAPAPGIPTAEGWRVPGERFGVSVDVGGDVEVPAPGRISWSVRLDHGGTAEATVRMLPLVDGAPVPELPPDLLVGGAGPVVTAGARQWAPAIASTLADLQGLRVRIPDMDLAYLGAGAPWFMALFGRDSLLTALEALPAGTGIALDVLEALARHQGRDHDPRTGEEPGRILHELRTGLSEVFGVASGVPYYGTVDASPLFVVLLDEAHRWGADPERVRALLPAARAALEWCHAHGDLDGDGFVEYAAHRGGLENQGWKDSGNALVHADGSQATGPIALSEVQAYVWAALEGLARLEERLGDAGRAPDLRARAAVLRSAFERDFWLPEQQIVALALDGEKRPLRVATSNIGHCLWAGILGAEVGAAAAERLAQPDLSTRWGIRTLASTEVAYSPLSYHLGSIWPHDSALGVAGMARYGQGPAAAAVTEGMLRLAEALGWRLPELIGGFDDTDVPYPVPYPVACSPQAWSAAAPLLLLRTALGLDVDVPAGRLRLAPSLPAGQVLEVQGLTVGSGQLHVRATGDVVEVLDAPDGLVVEGPGG